MIDLSAQPCPVCGKMDSDLLHRTTYPEYHYPGPFIMRRCRGCGLLFNSPRLNLEQLGALYGENYYFFLRNDSRELNRVVGMYQRTIALLDEGSRSNKRTIDIGCGRGYLPIVMRNLGWDASGVEISADAAEYGRSKFGLKVFTGTAEEFVAARPEERFPVVTAIDVIEHVPSPEEFIRAAASLVETGGRLIIDTPNGDAANIDSQEVTWKGFNPFHIYLFSINNLATLLTKNGLRIEQSFSYGNRPLKIGPRETLIAGLKKTRLLAPVVDVYFGWKKRSVRNDAPEPHVAHAVSRIKSESPYTSSVDASAPLAASKKGDNIVVVARKA